MKNNYYIELMCMVSVILFVACTQKEPTPENPTFKLNTTELSMNVGDVQTLDIISDLEYTVESEDLFVASITSERRNVKAEHVGKTTINVSNGKKTLSCDVEVIAKYFPFTEPYIPNYTYKNSHDWLSMSNYNDDHGFEYMESSSTNEYFVYNGKESNVFFIYYIDRDMNITEMKIVFFDVDKYEQSVFNYIEERFNYLGIENDALKYCNTYNSYDASLKVTLGTYTSETDAFVMLIYTPLPGQNVNI